VQVAEFHYRARLQASSFVPGAHPGHVVGGGIDVAAVVPLHRARDPRRLDLRAGLRDPWGGWWAREFHQRSQLAVVLLADVTASMAAPGRGDKHAVVGDLARSLCRSAQRAGDAYGQVAFDSDVLPALQLPPTRARQAASVAAEALAAHVCRGSSAQGLLAAVQQLPRRPALVLLTSDFHFDLALLDTALAQMARHDVVPVWLRDAAELEALPAHGLLELRDAESGRLRSLWMRPALRARWQQRVQAHREAVQACFARHQRAALVLGERFDADRLSDYFVARG
jgi:hypothetical protein